jgi:hypothetical protein
MSGRQLKDKGASRPRGITALPIERCGDRTSGDPKRVLRGACPLRGDVWRASEARGALTLARQTKAPARRTSGLKGKGGPKAAPSPAGLERDTRRDELRRAFVAAVRR